MPEKWERIKKSTEFEGDETRTRLYLDKAHGEWEDHVDSTTYIPGTKGSEVKTRISKNRIETDEYASRR